MTDIESFEPTKRTRDRQMIEQLRAAILLLLDHIDYRSGACAPTEMVGAVLPEVVITRARAALHAERDDD